MHCQAFSFEHRGKPNVFKLGTSPDGDAGYTVRTTKAPVPKSTGTCYLLFISIFMFKIPFKEYHYLISERVAGIGFQVV